jgi:hypothetical protein
MLIGHLYFLRDILVYLLSFYEIIFVSIKFLTLRLFQFRVNYNLHIYIYIYIYFLYMIEILI